MNVRPCLKHVVDMESIDRFCAVVKFLRSELGPADNKLNEQVRMDLLASMGWKEKEVEIIIEKLQNQEEAYEKGGQKNNGTQSISDTGFDRSEGS